MRIDEAAGDNAACGGCLGVLLVVYAGDDRSAPIVVLRSMARRWRDGETLDLPTPVRAPTARGRAVSLADRGRGRCMFVGVLAYAVFAGADFGCGFWDLTAGDADAGGRCAR